MSPSNDPIAAPHNGSGGYSAAVRLFVQSNGDRVPLAQVSGDRMYFREPVLLHAGPGELIVEVDGDAQRTPIRIPSQDAPARVIEYSVA